MKIVIVSNGLVADDVALRMCSTIVGREDGVVKFTDGLAVEIKTTKTQRAFTVVKRDEGD